MLQKVATLLLLAYPREFREEYRNSIVAHFEDEGADWRLALRTAADIIATAIAMRIEMVWRDLTYAARMDLRAPVFTIVVVGTLALAIGANAVIFTALDAVLLKPLPYAQADRLGLVYGIDAGEPGHGLMMMTNDERTVRALARSSHAFASVAVLADTAPLFNTSSSQGLHETNVTANYLETLGVHPELGRFFSSPAQVNEIVISDALWHKRFGGLPDTLGKRIKTSRGVASIIGVTPAGFLDPGPGGMLYSSDVWELFNPTAHGGATEGIALVRLGNGQTWSAAQADADRIDHILQLSPVSLRVQSVTDALFRTARTFFWIVFGAVGGVLLIACANVGNLLLARGSARESEFSVRASLGASSSRIAWQVFTETALLAIVGAAGGLILAKFALPAAIALVPVSFPRLSSARLDVDSLFYTCALVVLTTILAGIAPALATTTKRASRDTQARLVLVVLEVAIAFALTAGCGLLVRSFVAVTHVDVGFEPQNVYAASFMPAQMPSSLAATISTQRAMQIARAFAGVPGVSETAVATVIPFANNFMMAEPLLPIGYSQRERNSALPVGIAQVSPNYFEVMRMRVVRGRFGDQADLRGPAVALINASYATQFFGQTDPLGKRIEIDAGHRWQIVGIVADTRSSLTAKPQPLVYLIPQRTIAGMVFQIAVRTRRSIPTLSDNLTRLTKNVDPALPPPTVTSLQQEVTQDALRTQTSLSLLTALAGVALLLALVGIYGVVSYGTERRLREIGIRLALGASPRGVTAHIIRGTLLQTCTGLAVGIVIAALTTKLLSSQLFETSPLDPATFAAVAVTIAGFSAIAALVPAYRATRKEPSPLLRYE